MISAQTSNLTVRLDAQLKKEAEQLFNDLGMTLSGAINIFLHASIMEGGFPFQPKQPRYNRETRMAIQEARDIMAGKVEAKRYSSLSGLLEDLDAEDANA